MNLIIYSGCHDIIHTDEQQHAIVILWGISCILIPRPLHPSVR